ncbi:hypothetical protein BKA66DRAFT_571675 [Pyrenochaeta sp. MPI-SDFR-AT-0127]|nr:hypothetical protein BKA66DRAFT_571675 [Pyrenochaeta sp. MPI-SDFR-AT-0127]
MDIHQPCPTTIKAGPILFHRPILHINLDSTENSGLNPSIPINTPFGSVLLRTMVMAPRPLSATAPPTSPLLQLPSEIRNKIYEYALSSPMPLRPHPPLTTTYMYFAPTVPSRPTLIEGTHLKDYKTTQCPEFNQIRFVNRQLYLETAELEYQFNSILFSRQLLRWTPLITATIRPLSEYHRFRSSEQCFFDFIKQMKVHRISWLKTVIISSDVKMLAHYNFRAPPMPDLYTLVHFCKQHPNITMKYQYNDWNLKKLGCDQVLDFYTAGIGLVVALNSNESAEKALKDLSVDMAWLPTLIWNAKHWRMVWNVKDLLIGVDNFAFYPAANMQHIRGPILEYVAAFGSGQEHLSLWTGYASSWIKNGINTVERAI